ncbi:hypothetical protein HGRIS_004622 [Hohenbuehelia grisea]|uniref:enoyl-[acyl-carrier-protein] reductase n=1 Tax=Hohenbuehelia grisea TaxID=104357 RepID=A0ABR3JD80_9AGAR
MMLSSTSRLSSRSALTRVFSTSTSRTNRAIVYSQPGNPGTVLRALTYPPLASPPPNTLNIKFLLSPINPADINVVEGVYPAKPALETSLRATGAGSKHEPVFVGGNEGLAEVIDVGSGVSGFQKGDWVVMTRSQAGTWASSRNVGSNDVLKVPRTHGSFSLSEAQAATITVNPPTAYNMLHDFTRLQEGDWIVQNGGNSAVGQAVIQIASTLGYKTLNFVRNRENLSTLTDYLHSLGATKVLTYDELADKSLRGQVKEWTSGKGIRLGLNCVGGKDTTLMAQLLGQDAHLVSYGAMSKQPLSLPTSLFIFKNLTAHGFWQSQWYAQKGRKEQEKLMKTLVHFMSQDGLKAPEHEIVSIKAQETDEAASEKIQTLISRIAEGRYGKKIMLKLEDVEH